MANVTRRDLLRSAMAGGVALRAQERQVAYRDYSRCFPDYLRRLAREAYEKRNERIASLTTRDAVIARQHWSRETFWRLTGGKPAREAELNARVTGSFTRPGYRLEKVVYQSWPGVFISANLYLPTKLDAPAPGVLFQMGHTPNGKANDGYQKCCQGLARLGFVVLAFDPIGQGERTNYPNGVSGTHPASATEEHSYPGKQMLLIGDTASRFQVWDAVRSLDYLASRPEVDPKRLASTGQSGGGTMTMLLACIDERLAAAAVCSGITENFACKDFDPPSSTDDAEQDLIGSGEQGFDRWDLLYPMAPKPLLVSVSAKDFFGTYSPTYLSSGREEFQKLRSVYEVMGRAGAIEWVESPLPHGLSYDTRLVVYNFMRRALQGIHEPVAKEPDVRPEADRDLLAGPSGNVVRDFGSKTPFVYLHERLANIKTPVTVEVSKQERGERPFRVLSSVPSSGDVTIDAVEVISHPEIAIPAWYIRRNQQSNRVLLLLDDRGRNLHLREGGLGQQLTSRGVDVCAADLRGIGDLRPEVGRGAAGYTIRRDSDESYAWASLILGPSLTSQWTVDILALIGALSDKGRITIAARGVLTIPALCASLDPRIESVYLAGGLISYRSLVETENYKASLANMTFNALSRPDLPAIAAALGNRRVVLAGTLDASGMTIDVEAVRRIYASSNVEVRAGADWTAEALS